MATTSSRIAEQYPFLGFLANDPQVGPLLRRAVDLNTPYSPERFTAELMKTPWWRKKSDSQREWQILVNTRPGEANQRINDFAIRYGQAAKAYGVKLPWSSVIRFSRLGLSKGWDPAGPEALHHLSVVAGKHPQLATYGARRTNSRKIQDIAGAEYFYRMSNKNAATWGDRITRGLATEDDVRVALQSRAASLYPQYAAALNRGETMDQLTDGHKNIIAQELELDPETIDLSTGRWSKVLGTRDSGGKVRPMTSFEVLQHVRQDPRWWKTSHGKQTDAEWAGNILQMFGRRPSLGLAK